MALGTAKFGSGLLSVTLCRPSMTEVGIRVIIGRCDHRMYNAYYGTSLNSSDMTLTKDTNVNVRVQCSELSYDSGALGVNGNLLSSYHDIPDLNNDPIIYDNVDDLSTMKGDSVRYFVIPNAEPGTSYNVTISTDAVSDSSGGRLNEMTLLASTLSRDNLKAGTLSCQKHSYFDSGETFPIFLSGGSLFGWDQDTGEAKHTYGTQKLWSVVSADNNGLVTYTGSEDPSEEDPVCLYIGGINRSTIFVYVTSLDVNAKTFVAEDCRGNVVDFSLINNNAWASGGSMADVGNEPPAGLSGVYAERILATNPSFFASLDDTVYVSRFQFTNYMPVRNTADSRGDFVPRIQGESEAFENFTVNRDTGTNIQLGLITLARFYFLQPYNMEMLQKIPGVFVRGDWDLTTGNDFSHVPFMNSLTTPWANPNSIVPSANLNPMVDLNYSARMTEMVQQYAVGTSAWNVYFAAGNNVSFLDNKRRLGYPPLLSLDSNANSIDPVSLFNADPVNYYSRPFVIENDTCCIVLPDSISQRDGRFDTAWDNHPWWGNTQTSPTHICGGRYVWGEYQEQQIYKYLTNTYKTKTTGILNKGMILLGSYDYSEVNPDSAVNSARPEVARISTFMQSIGGALMQVGDRHVTYTERQAGKGRAEESGFIQQIISGAHQKSYGLFGSNWSSSEENDLTFGLINSEGNRLTIQTRLVTNDLLHNDYIEVQIPMIRTEYIPEAYEEVVGNEFNLAPSESRRFFCSPQLLTGEFIKAQIKTEKGFEAFGIVINQGNSSGVITNKSIYTKAFKLIKSNTTQKIKVEYS